MAEKLLIIGAGMAGLSAGIHARRNGFDAEIFEMHNLPGGLCTAWERKGFTFDGCISWLTGSGDGSQFNRLWREVGALEDTEIIDHDIFMSVEGSGGRILHIYSDLDRLEEHLIEYAPDDSDIIKDLIDGARTMARLEFPLEKPDELIKAWHIPMILIKMMPMFKVSGKFARVTIADYLKQIKAPFLREALELIMPTRYSMIGLITTLASFHNRDAGFPQGGSLQFARSIEKYFIDLGGAINYRKKVREIIIEEGQAVGLLLEDGCEVKGDIIISAADLHHTAYELLKGKYLTPLIRDSFKKLPIYTSVQVSMGVNCDLSSEDKKLAVKLDNPIKLGSEENKYLYITNHSYDPSLAPSGKTFVSAVLYSDYDYWHADSQNKIRYRDKKEKLAQQVVKLVEKRFPAARGNIEVVDVATPATYNHYTNVYKGAYMAWIVPPATGRFKIPKKMPGLRNFYQIGQWVEPPSGLPGSMLTGRHVVQIICHDLKRPFKIRL
jgi:phytoene dehydrogenase-like protein